MFPTPSLGRVIDAFTPRVNSAVDSVAHSPHLVPFIGSAFSAWKFGTPAGLAFHTLSAAQRAYTGSSSYRPRGRFVPGPRSYSRFTYKRRSAFKPSYRKNSYFARRHWRRSKWYYNRKSSAFRGRFRY